MACDYLSMQGLQLIPVSKRGYWWLTARERPLNVITHSLCWLTDDKVIYTCYYQKPVDEINSSWPSDAYMRQQTITDSGNGLSPAGRQAIIWTIDDIWSCIALRIKISKILIKIQQF